MGMIETGWLKLHRGLLGWEWYDDIPVKVLFLHLLLSVNYEPKNWHGQEIEAGQLVTSIEHLSAETSLTPQQIRTALNKLESTGEITRRATNKNTFITVENWGFYQCDEVISNKQKTNKQQTNNKQITTTKEVKNIRNKEIEKEIYKEKEKFGEFENVLLTEDEYQKLVERFPADYTERINNLSEYLLSKGVKYKSHYATILNWSRRDSEKKKPRVDLIDELIAKAGG